MEQWASPEYWTALCPSLHIEHAWGGGGGAVASLDEEGAVLAEFKQHLEREGYVHAAPPQLQWSPQDRLDELAQCVERVRGAGWPAVFSLMFDEFWLLATQARGVVQQLLGQECVLAKRAWVHYVDARNSSARDTVCVQTHHGGGSMLTCRLLLPCARAGRHIETTTPWGQRRPGALACGCP